MSRPDLVALEDLDRPDDGVLDPGEAVGVVAAEGRGSLPFSLVHGEALVACAAWALGAAGVELLDDSTPWPVVQELCEEGAAHVVHDALCPLLPPALLAAAVRRAHATGRAVLGVRPVTDTVKVAAPAGDLTVIGETRDREGLLAVASPLVLPPAVVAALPAAPPPGTPDLGALVRAITAAGVPLDVEPVVVPLAGARVTGADELALLAARTTGTRPLV